MNNYFSFFCFLFLFFIHFSYQLKWSPNELSKKVTAWNYLNDPENLIADKKLGPKIHTTYLVTNHVYDKTDVNLFFISDVIEKYVYKKKLFVEDLYKEMENNTEIDSSNKKQHHLLLVIIRKTKDCFIYGNSEKLNKLLPKNEVSRIEMEIKKYMKENEKAYAQTVYLVFDKLNLLWKRFSVHKTNNYKNKKSNDDSGIKDLIFIIPSIFVLGLFVFVLCCKRKTKLD
jgi:hypothetical protein